VGAGPIAKAVGNLAETSRYSCRRKPALRRSLLADVHAKQADMPRRLSVAWEQVVGNERSALGTVGLEELGKSWSGGVEKVETKQEGPLCSMRGIEAQCADLVGF
jgi:hypothetical protein